MIGGFCLIKTFFDKKEHKFFRDVFIIRKVYEYTLILQSLLTDVVVRRHKDDVRPLDKTAIDNFRLPLELSETFDLLQKEDFEKGVYAPDPINSGVKTRSQTKQDFDLDDLTSKNVLFEEEFLD